MATDMPRLRTPRGISSGHSLLQIDGGVAGEQPEVQREGRSDVWSEIGGRGFLTKTRACGTEFLREPGAPISEQISERPSRRTSCRSLATPG